MKKLIQTRLHEPPQKGNCYPTVIACFMDLDSPEDVIQIQEYYPEDGSNDSSWIDILFDWLEERGWDIEFFDGHLYDDSFYAVTGETIRGTSHICIYQNGKLYHDPHPSQAGLINEKNFEIIKPMNQ